MTGLDKAKIDWDYSILLALEALHAKNGLFNGLEMTPGQCILFRVDRQLSFPASGGGMAVLIDLDLSALPKRTEGPSER